MSINNAIIEIFREGSYANSARYYKVYIDGEMVDKIRDGEKKQIELIEGEHVIYLKIDWVRSKKIIFKINNGEIIYFKCGTKIKGLKMLLIFFYMFVPNTWVFIEKL